MSENRLPMASAESPWETTGTSTSPSIRSRAAASQGMTLRRASSKRPYRSSDESAAVRSEAIETMAVIGNPRSFHKKFKFIVEIDDIGHAGFQKCGELSVEVANVQYFEGGSLIPNKSPGRLTFADVTLERGATQDRDLFDWFQDVAITSSGLGLTDVNYKRNIDIVQQDRDGTTLRRWSLSRAWPVKFVAGDWDNESDENVIESVTLTFDFFELIQ